MTMRLPLPRLGNETRLVLSLMVFSAILLAHIPSARGQVPAAFPGAVGFGSTSIGGRGGTVMFVTNTKTPVRGAFGKLVRQPGAVSWCSG